jgi:hypothetical protein
MTGLLNNNDLDVIALDLDAKAGERIFKEVYDFLGRFVSYPSDHAHLAHVLWCFHTHLMDHWDTTPRLAFLSAEPGSGKTRALEITELLVPNPVSTVNVSPSYLFRKVKEGVTILYDEIDTVFGPKARDNEEIRGLLNAGHRKGNMTGRCVVRGKATETEEFPAYAAVAMAGLGWLPDTILSRSVIVRMRRRHSGEHVESYRRRIHGPVGESIRDRIAAWAHSFELAWPALPDAIQDRDADIWEPLIAIADAIGGDWKAAARVAAVSLVLESREADASLGIKLLGDLQTIFGDDYQLSSKTILERLIALPESPWGEIYGKPLDERGLPKRLKAYSVKPHQIRIGDTTPRGYSRADLEDQWRRYLPPLSDKSITSETTKTLPEIQGSNVSDVSDGLCEHCHRPGKLTQVAYGGIEARLHDGCVGAWQSKQDDLDIPGFLRREVSA